MSFADQYEASQSFPSLGCVVAAITLLAVGCLIAIGLLAGNPEDFLIDEPLQPSVVEARRVVPASVDPDSMDAK